MDHSYLLTLCNQFNKTLTRPQNFANTVRLNPAIILTLYPKLIGEQKLFDHLAGIWSKPSKYYCFDQVFIGNGKYLFQIFTHKNKSIWTICETWLQLLLILKVKERNDLETTSRACKKNLAEQVSFKSLIAMHWVTTDDRQNMLREDLTKIFMFSVRHWSNKAQSITFIATWQ